MLWCLVCEREYTSSIVLVEFFFLLPPLPPALCFVYSLLSLSFLFLYTSFFRISPICIVVISRSRK